MPRVDNRGRRVGPPPQARGRGVGLQGRFSDIEDTPFGVLFKEDEALRSWAATKPGMKEIVHWHYYAAQAYPTGGQLRLRMFNEGAGGAARGEDDTNLQNANQLPADQVYIVRSIGVWMRLGRGATADEEYRTGMRDFIRVLGNGSLTFTISHKDQHQVAPLWALPAGIGPYGPAWAGIVVADAAVQDQMVGQLPVLALPPKEFNPVIGIPPQHHFEVTLDWNAVQAVSVAGDIGVIMRGWLMRAVQ